MLSSKLCEIVKLLLLINMAASGVDLCLGNRNQLILSPPHPPLKKALKTTVPSKRHSDLGQVLLEGAIKKKKPKKGKKVMCRLIALTTK